MRSVDQTPYHSPRVAVPRVSRLSLRQSACSYSVAFGLLVFVAILATQRPYQIWAEATGIELPSLTTLSLRPAFPLMVGLLVFITIAARHAITDKRYLDVVDTASIIAFGSAAGYYLISLWLALPVTTTLS